METIAELHPIVVHFVIALGLVGVGLRVLSLLPFAPWSRHAATVLLLGAAAAGALAVKSGEEAHGPAERIPGARAAVKAHEETGEQARNALFVVALLEIGALALRKREKVARGVYALSAAAGLAAGYFIYEAGEHGGELVYEYAGGIGTRAGTADAADVQRLLIAGLYHQSRVAREAGNAEEAARLVDELVRQRGDDADVRLLGAESLLKDRQDPAGALAAIREFPGPSDNQSYVVRRGVLEADIYVALGQADSARAMLADLQTRYPEARAVKAALEKLR
jgi:uncharacterized membrane protein